MIAEIMTYILFVITMYGLFKKYRPMYKEWTIRSNELKELRKKEMNELVKINWQKGADCPSIQISKCVYDLACFIAELACYLAMCIVFFGSMAFNVYSNSTVALAVLMGMFAAATYSFARSILLGLKLFKCEYEILLRAAVLIADPHENLDNIIKPSADDNSPKTDGETN